jgi:protein ImuB
MSDLQPPVSSLYACLYRPPSPAADDHGLRGARRARRDPSDESSAIPAAPALDVISRLVQVAEAFSPRYERHGDDLVSIDIRGLERLLGSPRTIGEELRRDAADRGVRAHVAVARTRTAALVLALAHPGLRVIDAGEEAAALAPIPIGILEQIDLHEDAPQSTQRSQRLLSQKNSASSAMSAVKSWGIRSLGEFAALPAADLTARLGPRGAAWQAIARGEDTRPLVPARPEERFASTIELEWPIEGLEPLSFVLTRLLEPLSVRLEARDRGAAALHVALRLVTRDQHARRLELPSPLRDVRALRTLALLDLESHPPAAAIDQVTITIDPTPGRVLQHTLFARPQPTPEQLSTLLARLGALMGQGRIGAPETVDSYRPGAFAMKPFSTEHDHDDRRRTRGSRRASPHEASAISAGSALQVVSALRRCRHPVPARVTAGIDGRPRRVTTDRRGFAGGIVTASAGPWRSSGEWWETGTGRAGRADGSSSRQRCPPFGWDRDEWDVALDDGAVYRIFCDRSLQAWFIEGIVD